MVMIFVGGEETMNQIDKEVNEISADCELNGIESKEISIPDYDEQPYGNDDVLVRASKRRSFLASASWL